MLYVICLFPIVLYIVLVVAMDALVLANWKKTLECLLWGMAACTIAFYAKVQNSAAATLFEEVLKALPLAAMVYRKRSAFYAETLCYGAAAGAGFAILENIIYVSFNSGFTFGDAILRGFGTALLHMGCTALLSSVLLVSARIGRDMPKYCLAGLGLLSVLPSWAIHFSYNFIMSEKLIPEVVMLFIVVSVMIALFVIVNLIDVKLIHKWLDMCIANDIALLSSIRMGKLSDTNAGKYLIEAREKFPPENFFDILMYLQLYLDISVAAKSRMIMKDAGISLQVPETEHLANLDKLKELETLEKSIGKSGKYLLKPIIDIRAVDLWAMKELL